MLYLDPGSGSIALQVAVAGVVAGAFFMKRWWTTLTSMLPRALRGFRRQP
jgi:hypothetical protein